MGIAAAVVICLSCSTHTAKKAADTGPVRVPSESPSSADSREASRSIADRAVSWYSLDDDATFAEVSGPEDAPEKDFDSWAVTSRIAGFVVLPRDADGDPGRVWVALNRLGLVGLSIGDAGLDFDDPQGGEFFREGTVGGLYSWKGSPAALIYRNLMFEPDAKPASRFIVLDDTTGNFLPKALPYEALLPKDGTWETMYLELGDGSASLAEARSSANGRSRYRCFGFSLETDVVNEMPVDLFQMMAASLPVSRAVPALRYFLESVETDHASAGSGRGEQAKTDSDAVEFDFRNDDRGTRCRYLRGNAVALSSGDASFRRVPVVLESGRYAALADGKILWRNSSSLGSVIDTGTAGTASSGVVPLPALPQGFVWIDLALPGSGYAVASWEEEDWPDVGRSGLCVVSLP